MSDPSHQYFKAGTKTAERQMRQWALGLEVQERVEQQQAVQQLPRAVHPYIAFSRDTGAGASEVARRVAERLGWEVLNREVLDQMAQKYDLERAMLEAVDETTTSWMLEAFGKWISQRVVTNTEYTKRLGEVLLMAARHHSTVFVGRGAQFFLPRECGLTVQIVAPLQFRVDRICQREKLSADAARKHLRKKDQERRDYVREHFDRDVTDPHFYDLVINLEYFDFDWAVDLIVRSCEQRFGSS
jgi:cytidylate kinase